MQRWGWRELVTVNKTGTNRGLAKQWRESTEGNNSGNSASQWETSTHLRCRCAGLGARLAGDVVGVQEAKNGTKN